MMKKDKFERNLPLIVNDTQTALKKTLAQVGDGGLMDPFNDIYRIVYQLTMHIVGPTEFAESPEMLDETLRLFNIVERSLSPSRVVFPWLPTFGYLKQLFYGGKLYYALNGVVNARSKEGRRVEDALQLLMIVEMTLLKSSRVCDTLISPKLTQLSWVKAHSAD